MKQIFRLTLLLLFVVSCNPKQPLNTGYITLTGPAEGTYYNIKYCDSLGRNIQDELTIFFKKFEHSLSIYDSLSLISKLNRGDLTPTLDPWFVDCFNLSGDIYRRSEGLMDPTLRPLIAVYGFGGKGAARVLSDSQVDSILSFVGYDKVSIVGGKLHKFDPRIELDYNAVAKGFSVDLIGRYLDSLGIRNYLIDVGGEIFCRGVNRVNREWIVEIDTPYEGNYFPGLDTKARLQFSGKGLATSGNYRKYALNEKGEKVVHTIDPRTGKPSIHNLLSATVIAPTCGQADGFATACMVAGLEKAKKIIDENPELGALLIYSEGDQMKIFVSDSMKPYVRERKSEKEQK